MPVVLRSRVRRAVFRTALRTALGTALLMAAAPRPVQAQTTVAPAFAGKVTLNASYMKGLTQPTDIAFSADGRALVTTKGGAIVVRHADGSTASIAYPFGGTLDTAQDDGLLGVVADPAVAQNRAFYFYATNGPSTDRMRVYRAVLGASADTLAVDATPIIAASRGLGPGLEGAGDDVGGSLAIANGKLFVGVGDSGVQASPPVNKYGACLNKGNGKILRVNLDGTVPSDNPLVGLTSVTSCDSPTGAWTSEVPDPRIWAWGFRNPWRFTIDAKTNLMWIGDVGQNTSEEVSIGGGNQDYGYPFVEGSQTWGSLSGMSCSTMSPSRTCSPPAYTYDHSAGQAIMGGVLVEGCGWQNVFGGLNYLFADFGFGFIRVLPVRSDRTGLSSTTAVDFGSADLPIGSRMGPDGALYVILIGSGTVARYSPTSLTGPDCAAASVPAASRPWPAILAVGLGLVALGPARRRKTAGQAAFAKGPSIS